MSRRALLTAVPAALVAASIGAAVVGTPVGSPVDTADAARPFSVTKSQFTKVKTTSAVALKRSKANSRQIARLRQASVAGAGVPGPQGPQGPQGAQGPAGGFEPAKVTRVTGPVVPVPAGSAYVGYTLPCPAGTIALSGGWYTSLAATQKQVRVPASYPTSKLSGWSFRFAYAVGGLTSANVTPYVVCAGA